MQSQHRQLARERDPARHPGPVQRLLAETIACEMQLPCPTIDDGEREHAVQALRQPLTPRLIAVHEHFGIGVAGAEYMTELKELPAQLDVVVNLAVEDYPDRSILVPHRLTAAGDVDDGEAPVAEMYAKLIVDPSPFSVRPAMGKLLGHALEQGAIDGPDEADQAAHHTSRSKFTSSWTR